mmetsp:Transcript_1147/g.4839  ORF Transcript_1147/g.4839 Transcript_1147/m.4839 type:complete len:267 (+) Transcript_1147:2101-2901(+)
MPGIRRNVVCNMVDNELRIRLVVFDAVCVSRPESLDAGDDAVSRDAQHAFRVPRHEQRGPDFVRHAQRGDGVDERGDPGGDPSRLAGRGHGTDVALDQLELAFPAFVAALAHERLPLRDERRERRRRARVLFRHERRLLYRIRIFRDSAPSSAPRRRDRVRALHRVVLAEKHGFVVVVVVAHHPRELGVAIRDRAVPPGDADHPVGGADHLAHPRQRIGVRRNQRLLANRTRRAVLARRRRRRGFHGRRVVRLLVLARRALVVFVV